jgi:ADP-heptose:LPS heptosyltransferase
MVAAGLETPDIPDLVCLSSIAHQMDCIVTVDTLCAHIGAGVNTRTIMMSAANPDFRWGLNDTVSDVAYQMQNFQVVRQKKVGVWTPEEIQTIADLCA